MSTSISSATYIPKTSPYLLFFSKKLSSSCAMLYVSWCKVSPCPDNTYKYSPSEYAHILNLSFLVGTFFSCINGFILEFFLSKFPSSALLLNQGIPFYRCCYHYNLIRLLALDRRDYLCNLTMVLCYSRYRLRKQIV